MLGYACSFLPSLFLLIPTHKSVLNFPLNKFQICFILVFHEILLCDKDNNLWPEFFNYMKLFPACALLWLTEGNKSPPFQYLKPLNKSNDIQEWIDLFDIISQDSFNLPSLLLNLIKEYMWSLLPLQLWQAHDTVLDKEKKAEVPREDVSPLKRETKTKH